jgi:sugar/nucleoside kinase (ribokinase family)
MPEIFDVVAAGHICLDVITDLSATSREKFERSFVPGRLLLVGPVTFSTGGPVSNVGLALTRLGIETRLMGKVGNDLFGQAVQEIVSAYGPHLVDGMVVDETTDTSYTIVISPPGIDRYLLHHPGANDTFSAEDVRYDVVAQARLFHFGYPPVMRLMYENDGAQLVGVFRHAKATSVTTSLDTAMPDPSSPAGRVDWRAILKAALPYVDVFLPSVEEILYMLRRPTFDDLDAAAPGGDILPLLTPQLLSEVSRELLDFGARLVAIKLGYRGLYLRTAGAAAIQGLGRACPSDPAAWADKELWAPCFQADLVGTAGSGDSTIAGFLSALLRDMSPEEAVTAALAVGACNVEAPDTLSGLRSWEDTMARVAAGWARHPLDLQAHGWQFDSEHHLWVGRASA